MVLTAGALNPGHVLGYFRNESSRYRDMRGLAACSDAQIAARERLRKVSTDLLAEIARPTQQLLLTSTPS